jgi:hypothetical protein
MFIYTIGVERVRVGHVANLCVTRSGTCEMRDSQIVQHILDSLRMATVTCYLVSVFVCLLFMISIV